MAISIDFQPATPDDAEEIADILTAAYPEYPEDPVAYRHAMETAPARWLRGRYIARIDGRGVGYASWVFAPIEDNDEKYGRVQAVFASGHDVPENYTAALDRIESEVTAAGARVLRGWVDETALAELAAFESHGYGRDRYEKAWELDLGEARERILGMAARSRAAMAEAGIRLMTMAANPDPRKMAKLFRVDVEAAEDVPRTGPFIAPTKEEWVDDFMTPGITPERIWIAVTPDDDIVAMSLLWYPPVRGHVSTAFTATARSHRGRGIARAVKNETLMQALELGVTSVRTDNDSSNAPMLHINETLGYHQVPGWHQMLKRLS